jgi:uncharacterized phage protein (TIGR02218 family)
MKSQVTDYRYRVLCLRIVPRSGPTIRLTHYPRNLTMSNGQVYLSGSGYDFTGYSASSSMSPAMIDMEGIAGIAGIGRDQIASGVFDNARCYLFATTWNNPVEDYEPIVVSILGKTTLMDDRYKVEEMALIDALNQSVGFTYTASCPKQFGGQEFAGCKKDLAPLTVTGTLTAVTSNAIFRDAARTEAADYFGAGTIQFTSGANAGLKPQEIKSYAADGTIETFEPFYYALAPGDAYTMVPGCRKRKEDCRDKWQNIVNFGGFSEIPTGSTYAQIGLN